MDGELIKVKQKIQMNENERNRKQTIDAFHPSNLFICEKY